MRFLVRGRSALLVALAVAILSACGGTQNVTSLPLGATAQGHKASGSWMKREASNEDLIYVSSSDYYPTSNVQVFSYPGGALVGTLTGFKNVQNICSDTSGNVWVLDLSKQSHFAGYAYEYAHGATNPKLTLEDNGYPLDCSMDTSSGNLAVSNDGSIAIYPNGTGSPEYISTSGFLYDNDFVTYDGSGNLYFASHKRNPAWIPNGGTIAHFHIKPKAHHGGLGWDGQYFTVLIDSKIYQYTPIGNKSGKAIGLVSLNGIKYNAEDYYSIEDSLLAIAYASASGDEVLAYSYPQGGNPTLTIAGLSYVVGVAISVAPSRPHKRR